MTTDQKSAASNSAVLAHYATGYEAGRLQAGPGQLEHARTQEILTRYLPSSPARIADIGGGPGVYAAWLAGRGYQVSLIDLVPLHVQQAQERFAEHGLENARAEWGDARQLPFPTASQDAVVLLGPMYHLTERKDRVTALLEAVRVLRPGGVLVAAFISRFASLLDGFFRGFIEDPLFLSIVEQDLATGRHENPTQEPFYFTTGYFHHPEEIGAELREAGLAQLELFAVEGPFWCLPNFDEHWSSEDKRERMLRFVRRIERDPSLAGVSAHILAVARHG
jgi:ubiquinone/menaquinone biosynthesis C-methylase UbiE